MCKRSETLEEQNHYNCLKCGENIKWHLDLLRNQCCLDKSQICRRQDSHSAYRIVWHNNKTQLKKQQYWNLQYRPTCASLPIHPPGMLTGFCSSFRNKVYNSDFKFSNSKIWTAQLKQNNSFINHKKKRWSHPKLEIKQILLSWQS